jgi:RimJ/RimL family protein N-acetyltransferase
MPQSKQNPNVMETGSRIETARLVIRPFTIDDAAFVLELVNDPAWIQHIGDRGVRSLADAREYLSKGPLASYARNGFGFNLVQLKSTGEPIGGCGLIKREMLNDVDLGFAFLSRFRGLGYAEEAARAMLENAQQVLGFDRIVAVVAPANTRSIALLQKLGFTYESSIHLTPDDPEEISLFVWQKSRLPPDQDLP